MKIQEDPKNRKVFLQISELLSTNKAAIRKAFYYIGKDLVATAKAEIMKRPKHGITYRIAKGGRIISHTASAAGEAPANLTGFLKNGLDFEVQGSDEMTFGVKDKVHYAAYLELGTRKIEPRPYVEASIKVNYGNIQKHFEEQLQKSLNTLPASQFGGAL